MRTVIEDDGIRISDCLWEQIESLIPNPIDNHPLKCHKKRVDNRIVMDAIFFVLRTGCQWEALDSTAICKHSVAHKRFQEWVVAGVFETFWARGLLIYDKIRGLNLKWQSIDGSMTKSPLGGEATGANPTDRAKKGPRGASLAKQMEFLSGLLLQEQTGMTARWLEKPLKASLPG